MNLHYSLFKTTDDHESSIFIDLSQVIAVHEAREPYFDEFVVFTPWQNFRIDCNKLEEFITAWNRYKHAAAAAQLIKIPEQANPTVACNSAFRIDEYLGFLAGEKLKKLAELAEKKAA